MSTSLGHLIVGCRSATLRTVSHTETAAQAVSKAGRRSGSGGNSNSDISTLLPGGACQERPYCPRPAVCARVRMARPCCVGSSANDRASVLVLSRASWTWTRWPRCRVSGDQTAVGGVVLVDWDRCQGPAAFRRAFQHVASLVQHVASLVRRVASLARHVLFPARSSPRLSE